MIYNNKTKTCECLENPDNEPACEWLFDPVCTNSSTSDKERGQI